MKLERIVSTDEIGNTVSATYYDDSTGSVNLSFVDSGIVEIEKYVTIDGAYYFEITNSSQDNTFFCEVFRVGGSPLYTAALSPMCTVPVTIIHPIIGSIYVRITNVKKEKKMKVKDLTIEQRALLSVAYDDVVFDIEGADAFLEEHELDSVWNKVTEEGVKVLAEAILKQLMPKQKMELKDGKLILNGVTYSKETLLENLQNG